MKSLRSKPLKHLFRSQKATVIATVSTFLTLGFACKAEAISFNLSYDSSLTNYAYFNEVRTATQNVANQFSSLFGNNAVVNILIAGTGNGLGEVAQMVT
jgi:hypothetical protein